MSLTLRDGLGRPLTHSELDENFEYLDSEKTDALKSIALALNVPREAVLNGVAGQVITVDAKYLYNPVDQTTWGLPAAVGTGEVIISVVGDQLETDVSSPSKYTMVTQGVADLKMTIAEAVESTDIKLGDSIRITDRADGIFDVVLALTVSTNGKNIVQCVGIATLALSLRQYSGYVDPIKLGASESDKTKNAPVFQQMLEDGVHIISHRHFEIDAEVGVPSGARFNFLRTGGIYCSDGFMTSGTGKSLLVNAVNADDILYEGMTLNGNAGVLDFAKWPNTDATGNEASVGLTRPVKLVVHQNSTNVMYKSCNFINTVGGGIKEFATANNRDINLDDCYWDLIRGNCVDGDFARIVMTRQRVNLIGDIRLATRGGLIVTACDDTIVSDIYVRQSTDSTIYISGSNRGKSVVSGVFIRYSGKDAVKVLTGSKDSLFSNINVTAAGKTPVGFFGGTVANGALGTIKIGFANGDAPTNILDQTDVTWSTPKTITACNIQEAKWDLGGGNGGSAFAVADSNVAFSTLSIASYKGIAISTSATKVSGGNIVIDYGDGPGVYATTSSINLENLNLTRTNQDLSMSPLGKVHAIELLGTSNINVDCVNFADIGGGLIKTGPDTFRLNISSLVGGTFNTQSNSDAHMIYANSAASPNTVTDINISNVAVSGSTTAGRMLYARNCKDVNLSNWTTDGGSDGVRLSSCLVVNASNVICRGAAYDGFRASTCSNISLSNVQGHDSGSNGVKVDSDCANVVALGCQGSGNGAANLSIQGTNVRPTVISDFNIG